MKLFIHLEENETRPDEFLMAKAVYDSCKEQKLNADTVSRMILLKTEDDYNKNNGRRIGYGISEEV